MIPRILSIAGSDSGGGAGIQADLKTFQAMQTYGMTVVTAITAQNTIGVDGVQGVDAEMVRSQFKSVNEDIGIDAIKIGMLFSEEIIQVLAEELKEDMLIVLDPVIISTSNHILLPIKALECLIEKLFPKVTIITPNIPEAEFLLKCEPITNLEEMLIAATNLSKLGCRYVYLKGGHLPLMQDGEKVIIDILYDSLLDLKTIASRPYIVTTNTHGTGCTLSSAIAAQLGLGKSMDQAVKIAGDYVHNAIASAVPLGKGNGPISHHHNLLKRTVLLPITSTSTPLDKDTPFLSSETPFLSSLVGGGKEEFKRYTQHSFPILCASGKMNEGSFKFFLKQDYKFLLHYARVYSLLSYRSTSIEGIAANLKVIETVMHETENHKRKCLSFGISFEDLLETEESITCLAYSRYLLDIAASDSILAVKVATAPCLLGYGLAAARLFKGGEDEVKRESNPYWYWIEEYAGKGYQGAVTTGIADLEKMVVKEPIAEQELKRLQGIFRKATELEIAFWNDALTHSSEQLKTNGTH